MLEILIDWSLICNISILYDCRSGGIGRHAWFRVMCPNGCGSSSLPYGTRPSYGKCISSPPLVNTDLPSFSNYSLKFKNVTKL